MNYNDFRGPFWKKMQELDAERDVGLVIGYAEAYPFLVKEPYRFLLDGAIPREEKAGALKAIYPIAGNDSIKLAAYVMNDLDIDAFRMVERPAAFIGQFLDYVSKLFGEAQKLVDEAKRNGLDVSLEEARLRERHQGMDEAKTITQLADSLLALISEATKDGSEAVQ